jgi:acyl-homoserine lactone acylase PvdQ
MMTKDEALELCDYLESNDASLEAQCKAAAFIREALAQHEERYTYGTPLLDLFINQLAIQPRKNPVAWLIEFENGEQELHFEKQDVGESCVPLCVQRPWVGLTEDDISSIWHNCKPYYDEDDFARAVEAALRSTNK